MIMLPIHLGLMPKRRSVKGRAHSLGPLRREGLCVTQA